ncbi:MAG: hypothetical protein ACI837_001701 [Crocinitomicaceae bacterium]|jgi:hypothetical protein
MRIVKELVIAKPIEDVWEVLANQFGEVDKWASLIRHSEVSGVAKLPGVDYSIRKTKTTSGDTSQELTAFNPEQHLIAYKALTGLPGIVKTINAKWDLTVKDANTTELVLDFVAEMKGIGHIIAPIAKKKLGKVGDVLLEDFKFYIETGKPHPRKVAAS